MAILKPTLKGLMAATILFGMLAAGFRVAPLIAPDATTQVASQAVAAMGGNQSMLGKGTEGFIEVFGGLDVPDAPTNKLGALRSRASFDQDRLMREQAVYGIGHGGVGVGTSNTVQTTSRLGGTGSKSGYRAPSAQRKVIRIGD